MKRLLVTLHVVFIFVGVANTILGPLLPLLAQRWLLNDRAAGVLFLVMFLGGFTGALISTRLGQWLTLLVLARTGLLLIAGGLALLSTATHSLAILAVAAIGIGLGFTNPAINTMASEAVPHKRAAILNLLNFAWAVGAIAAPNALLAALRHTRFNVQALLACFAIVMAVSAFAIPAVNASTAGNEQRASAVSPGAYRLIAACAVLAFLYVGVESAISGWLPTYATRIRGFTYADSALLQGTFWTTFLLGRLAAPALLRSISDRLLLSVSIAIALFATVALLLTGKLMFVSVGLLGLGCAAIFPTAVAVLSQRASSQLGFVFASAGLGAAALPFLVGLLSTTLHDLERAMWLIVLAEIALVFAQSAMFALVVRGDRARLTTDPAAQ